MLGGDIQKSWKTYHTCKFKSCWVACKDKEISWPPGLERRGWEMSGSVKKGKTYSSELAAAGTGEPTAHTCTHDNNKHPI